MDASSNMSGSRCEFFFCHLFEWFVAIFVMILIKVLDLVL
jgi:hypothetical protein